MDTEKDYVDNYEEDVLGANEKDFLDYLEEEYDVTIKYKDTTPADVKTDIFLALKDLYWKEYIETLEFARNAELEHKLL